MDTFELLKKSTKVKNYFTTWSLITFIFYIILSNYVKIPSYMFISIENLVLMCSIIGYYIVRKYIENIIIIEKVDKTLLIFLDIISHIIPFIYIIFYRFNKYNDVDIIKQIVHTLIFSFTYLILVKEEESYKFTGWSQIKLINIAFMILFFITIIRQFIIQKQLINFNI